MANLVGFNSACIQPDTLLFFVVIRHTVFATAEENKLLQEEKLAFNRVIDKFILLIILNNFE